MAFIKSPYFGYLKSICYLENSPNTYGEFSLFWIIYMKIHCLICFNQKENNEDIKKNHLNSSNSSFFNSISAITRNKTSSFVFHLLRYNPLHKQLTQYYYKVLIYNLSISSKTKITQIQHQIQQIQYINKQQILNILKAFLVEKCLKYI